MQSTKAIFARRIFGPFIPPAHVTLGNPATYYQTAENKAEHMARHYAAFRKRGYTATEARKRALALPAAYQRGFADGYGTSARLGAVWTQGGTALQWAERPEALGFRFAGYADELARLDHRGWFNRDDCEGSTLRAVVYRLPHGRLIPAYREMEGRAETNPGSAALALGEMIRETGGAEDDGGSGHDGDSLADCARRADGIAQSVAEAERENDSAYQAGARAAREIAEAEETRAEARALIRDIRAAQADMRALHAKGAIERPAICKALQAALAAKLEAIAEAREKRARAWSDCPSWLEDAWRDGYATEADSDGWNRFARTLGLRRFKGEAGNGLITIGG